MRVCARTHARACLCIVSAYASLICEALQSDLQYLKAAHVIRCDKERDGDTYTRANDKRACAHMHTRVSRHDADRVTRMHTHMYAWVGPAMIQGEEKARSHVKKDREKGRLDAGRQREGDREKRQRVQRSSRPVFLTAA